jgi:hypothetical protein
MTALLKNTFKLTFKKKEANKHKNRKTEIVAVLSIDLFVL